MRAAALDLGIAHSAVSRHVSQLGAWLGTPLTGEPSGRAGIRFTPAGEHLGRALADGFEVITAAVAAVREARSADSVVVSTSPSFAARWLLPRLPALEAAHPDLEVSVVVSQTLVDLGRGEVDLALRMGSGRWPGARSERFLDDVLFPVMSERYWRRHGEPRNPHALRRLRLLHDRDLATSWARWRDLHGPSSLDVRKGPRFTSSDLLLRAAAQGLGVALAHGRLAADDLASGALLRPFGDLRIELGPAYWIVVPEAVAPREPARRLIAWLHAAAARPR